MIYDGYVGWGSYIGFGVVCYCSVRDIVIVDWLIDIFFLYIKVIERGRINRKKLLRVDRNVNERIRIFIFEDRECIRYKI